MTLPTFITLLVVGVIVGLIATWLGIQVGFALGGSVSLLALFRTLKK